MGVIAVHVQAGAGRRQEDAVPGPGLAGQPGDGSGHVGEAFGGHATTADGLAVWDEQALSVHADSESEILLFDLPPV